LQPVPDDGLKVVRLDLHNRSQRSMGAASLGEAESQSDGTLFNAVKEGNAEALGTLYNRYVAKVYRIAKRLIQDEQTIQEIIQDVFTRIWTTQSFDPNLGVFDHWIAVVTRRIVIDHIRRRRMICSAFPQDDLTVVDDTAERNVNNRMLRNDLLDALSKLDSDQSIVLELAYFKGYTLAEISVKLGIPLGTVKTKLHKGLKKMRISLQNWSEEVQQ
jgi:RNA polymerase sigma-70 factor (ECF subfamily)